MYVCICNGITDTEIRTAVHKGGVRNADEAYRSMDKDFCCGTCRDCAQCIVDEELPNTMLLAAE